jgi:hypothetical protein
MLINNCSITYSSITLVNLIYSSLAKVNISRILIPKLFCFDDKLLLLLVGRGEWEMAGNCSTQEMKHKFNGHGFVHRKNILIYIQQDAMLHILFYLETALHVSVGTITDHQERKQLYPQHLAFVTPLLLSAAIVEELEQV